jgi:transcriptional regulator with XRE-family HTH domain
MISFFRERTFEMTPPQKFNGVHKELAGKLLQQKRKARGLTQEQFSELIGMNHYQYLSSLETGKVDWRSSDEYKAPIIRELNFSRDELESIGIGEFELRAEGIDLEQTQYLEVSPEWLKFEVLGTAEANPNGRKPKALKNVYAYVPLEQLKKRGSQKDNIRVYLANGDCMVSDGVRKSGKNIGHHDFIAVDTQRPAVADDIVVAWDSRNQKMLVKLISEDEAGESIVFYPLNSAYPPIVRSRDEIHVFGVVVWRGGGL